ncbi:MAG: dihydrofolate reductase [Rickettsiaceae bacterium]
MTLTRDIIGIMAATKKGVIGNNKRMPWNYPDERQNLIRMTKEQCVIMGRKTFESIPTNFYDDRTPIIFSRSQTTQFFTVQSIAECLAIIDKQCANKKIFMIGGAEIAHLFLQANLISQFLLTTIHHSYKGDVGLDMSLLKNWSKNDIMTNSRFTISKLTPEANIIIK